MFGIRMSIPTPKLSLLQTQLQQHAIVWLCAPQGYDQSRLCQQLGQSWPAGVLAWPDRPHDDELLLIPDLDKLDETNQQALIEWLCQQPSRPGLCLINSRPCHPLEGRARRFGLHPCRLDAQQLGWQTAELADWLTAEGQSPDTIARWQPTLGAWPHAWQLWLAAVRCATATGPLLQRWGQDWVQQQWRPIPPPLPQALALQAEQPCLDETALLQLAGYSRGQWQRVRETLLDAGWLLEQSDGDHWQPWIRTLLIDWREQPGLDWQPLSRLLADLPLDDILQRLPLTPLPELELSLFSQMGLRFLEQGRGHWLAERLAALPRRWLQQQPSLCLLQAWVEMEVLRRSDRAEELLNRLLDQPLPAAEISNAHLLKAMVSFYFDHLDCAESTLNQLEALPQRLQAPYLLTQGSTQLFQGQLARARPLLESLISWADCQGQYHVKLIAWYRLAQLYLFLGDWALASKFLHSGLAFAAQEQLQQDAILDSYYRLLAELALYQGLADQAASYLQQGQPLAAPLGSYWALPYLGHQCLISIWRQDLDALPSQLEQLEHQRLNQQYCRLWRYRVGLTLALGYQQTDDRAGLERLLLRSPWHTRIRDLFDLLDNLVHAWIAEQLDRPRSVDELLPLELLAEEWQAAWLVWQFRLLQRLRIDADPASWQPLISELAQQQARLPLLLAGPRLVAPLQALARWPQLKPELLGFIQQALDLLTRPLPNTSEAPTDGELSQRQWQILRLIAQGFSNEQMARQLFIAPSTIKTHINHLYAKLGVRTRAEAQAVARQKLVGKR